jgi:hypothetical protein
MDKENIYEYVLEQKQLVELECLKINTQLQLDSIFPDNVGTIIEELTKEFNEKNDELNRINQEQAEKEAEKNKMKKNVSISNKLFLSFDDIINLLSSNNISDGTYGIINYYCLNKTIDESKANDLIIKYVSDKKYEYYNKPAIVKKLIEKGKFTEQAVEESYGFVFMYEKNDDDITDLNKVYLMKNGDINYINKINLENSENDDETEKIITKIYNFVSDKKIVLKDIIYESGFNTEEIEIDETLPSNNKNNLEDEISDITERKKLCENFNKQVKKYKKYLNDNIKSEDIKDTFNNFTNIKTLIKKISDPTKCILDINNFSKFNWSNKFTDIKISNKYDEPEYSNLIKKYYDDSISNIVTNLIDIYNLNGLFKNHLQTFIEILLRAYVDEHLGHQNYCLGKNLCEYLKLASVMPEPKAEKIALRKRYWTNALESSDNKRFVISLLNTLNTKTQTLDQTLKYLSSLEINILSNSNQINV